MKIRNTGGNFEFTFRSTFAETFRLIFLFSVRLLTRSEIFSEERSKKKKKKTRESTNYRGTLKKNAEIAAGFRRNHVWNFKNLTVNIRTRSRRSSYVMSTGKRKMRSARQKCVVRWWPTGVEAIGRTTPKKMAARWAFHASYLTFASHGSRFLNSNIFFSRFIVHFRE